MFYLTDVLGSFNEEVDFSVIKRIPSRPGELVTFNNIMYEFININTVINKDKPSYIQILVQPFKEKKR